MVLSASSALSAVKRGKEGEEMAVKKGPVLIRRPHEEGPLALGMCYLATRTAPSGRETAGGTITRLQWAPGVDIEGAGPGAYRLEFDDGTLVDISVTRHLFTACGPEVLRFQCTQK